jgi:hypothetical protein
MLGETVRMIIEVLKVIVKDMSMLVEVVRIIVEA